MSADVATLAVKIDSSPVVTLTNALTKLTGTAQPAERAVKQFEQSVSKAGSATFKWSQQNVDKLFGIGDKARDRGADIEAYGRALDDTRAKFNPLYAAGRLYRETLDEINRANRVGAINETERAQAVNRLRAGYVQQINTLRSANVVNKQLNQTTGLARHEMVNLSRQVQDIGVSLASGQSPFLVLIQQGTQVADIFASSQATAGGFAKQILGVITPVRLLTAGILATVGGVALALNYWKNYQISLDNAARSAGMAAIKFSQLQDAASVKGVNNQEFQAGMQSFAAELYRAQNNAGELREVFRVNGLTIKDNADALGKVADLIANSTSYQQKLNILQKAGLPTSAEFVRFMEQGSEKIKEVASQLGTKPNDQFVKIARDFEDAWSKAWTNFGSAARNAIGFAASGLEGLAQEATDGFLKLRAKLGITEAPSTVIDYRFPRASEQFGKLDLPGTKKTVDPDQIRFYEQLRASIKGKVEEQKIELATQTMTAGAAARYRAVQEALNAADQQHINLSPAQVEALKNEASELVGLTDATRDADAAFTLLREAQFERAQLGRTDSEQQIANRMRAAYGESYAEHMNDAVAGQMRLNNALATTKTLAEDAFSGFLTSLAQGKSFMDSLRNSLQNLESQLIKLAANRVISELFGAALGGGTGGGILNAVASLFHSGRGPGDSIQRTRTVPISEFVGAPRHHSGIGPGEHAAVIRDDESVLTPGQMRALGRQIGGGGRALSIAPVVNVTAPAGGGREDGARFGAEIGRQIVTVVQNELIKQMRFGGLLRAPA